MEEREEREEKERRMLTCSHKLRDLSQPSK
jgi:hypothetical protein